MDVGTKVFWTVIALLLSASVFFAVDVEERKQRQGVVPASSVVGAEP
jgi:hypothetical protein